MTEEDGRQDDIVASQKTALSESEAEAESTPRLNSVLVDKVGFVLAECDSDQKLERAVQKYLLALLRNVSVSDPDTRAKVMEILTHLNKRIKSQTNVAIPVELLLQAFASDKDSFFKNFAIVYIKMGFSRLSYQQKVSLMPSLFYTVENQPANIRRTLLTLFISVFGDSQFQAQTRISPVKEPENEETNQSNLDPCLSIKEAVSSKCPESFQFILQYFTEVLLLSYVRTSAAENETPGGFSKNSYIEITKCVDESFSDSFLEKVKIGIVRLLVNLDLKSELKYPLFLVASSDSHHSVTEVAENALRHYNDSVNLDDLKLAQRICLLFCGDKRPKTPVDDKTSPVSTRTKLKLLPVLSKSKTAANQPLDVISVVFEACFGTGATNKLRHSALGFVHHVAHSGSDATLKTVGPLLKTACVKLLTEVFEPPLDSKTINFAALAVAKLAFRKPDLMNNDFALLTKFFSRLKEGDREQKMALQEALAVLAPVYSDLPTDKFDTMQEILESVLELRENSAVKQILLKFIQHCFPFDHVPSRYFILALTESSDDVFHLLASRENPTADFSSMMEYIKTNEKIPLASLSSEHVERICHFLRFCLLVLTDKTAELKPSDLKSQTKILSESFAVDEEKGTQYASFLLSETERHQTPKMFFYLTEVCHVSAPISKNVFSKHLNWSRSLTVCYSDALRLASCEFYGTLKASIGENLSENELKVLEDFNDKNAERFNALCLSLGYFVVHEKRFDEKENIELAQHLLPLLSKDSKRVFDIAVESLSIVCAELDIGKLMHDEEQRLKFLKDMETVLGYTDAIHLKRKENVVNFLGNSCLGVSTCKSGDWAIKCMEVLLKSSDIKQHDIQPIVGRNLVKCALGKNYPHWRSWLCEPKWSQPITAQDSKPDLMEDLLDRIIKTYCNSAIPHVPQTCAHWLSEILGTCPPHHAIQSRARQLQSSLMGLLSSKSETVQDLASDALSNLFHMCDETQKNSLIDHMMAMFTHGSAADKNNKPKIKSGDEELFSEGEIGKTPSGGSISTYKDLCSLATDLNKPDLVYKFISLSNHNMMWNSRKGAAFGFSYLAEQASSELEPHFPKLLPKLFRYKFDPNPQVRDSMTRIWSALASNSKDVVEKYAYEICVELMDSLQSTEWRSREAACLALSDFSSTHVYSSKCSSFIEQFWTLAFARCDDIKDSVRVAGERCLSSLSRGACKCCGMDSHLGPKEKAEVVSILVPVLVSNGLSAKLKIVSDTSLNTILELCSEGRARTSVLKPHMSQMMQALLDSLSDNESSHLNYLSVRAGEGSQIQTAFDSARASSARSSRSMDCLVRLTNQIDDSNVEQVVSVLCSTVQSAVGFSTKTGVCHVIALMTFNCGRDVLEPHAGKLVKKMTSKLSDKNAVVRSAFSSTIPNVLKVAKSSIAHKYFAKLRSWFLENHDIGSQLTCANAFSDACRNCPDTILEHLDVISPVGFVGKHFVWHSAESDQSEKAKLEELKELYDSVWMSCVTSTNSGVKIYVDEITSLCEQLFECQSWHRKAQAASAIAHLAKALFGSSGPEDAKHNLVDKFVSMLLNALSGSRFWTGKEVVMASLSELCNSCGHVLVGSEGNLSTKRSSVLELVFDQWTRTTERKYELACVASVGICLSKLQMDQQWFERMLTESEKKLEKYFSTKEDRRLLNNSNDEQTSRAVSLSSLQSETIKAIANAYPELSTLENVTLMGKITELFNKFLLESGDKTAVKIGVDCLEMILKKCKNVNQSDLKVVWGEYLESLILNVHPNVITTESLQISFLKLLQSVVEFIGEAERSDSLKAAIHGLCQTLKTSYAHHSNISQLLRDIQKSI